MSSLATSLAAGLDTALDRAVLPGFTAFGHAVRRRLPSWPPDPEPGALHGRRVAVTGATSGLGLRTTTDLIELGADVLMVVRDTAKGRRVADEVRRSAGEAQRPGAIEVWHCDISDLDSVHDVATGLVATGEPLHGLVHNAGALPAVRIESPQGHELTMALHVLGPVLLTELLLPVMAGQGARVVFVTSGGMYTQRLPGDDPDFRRGDYDGPVAYARSKRGQVELLPVLAQRWGAHGVAVDAMHPGWAATPGLTTSLPRFERALRPALRTAGAGADTSAWLLASAPAPPTGLLWHDRRPRPTSYLARTAPTQEQRNTFWQWVAESTGLE